VLSDWSTTKNGELGVIAIDIGKKSN
jgi:hypothetical protein